MPSHAGFVAQPLVTLKVRSSAAALANGPAIAQDNSFVSLSNPLKGFATDTQPVTEIPSTGAGHRMPAFGDDFYNHIIIEPQSLDVGNLVSNQVRTVDVFNGYFVQKTLTQLLETATTGLSITGDLVPTVYQPLETKTYTLTVTSDGPAIIDASYQFNWSSPEDNKLFAVKGVRLVAIPYQAIAPWSETLEWLTSVITSVSGKEQRVRLRASPRQSFSATFPVPYSEMAKAYNLTQGWKFRTWALPVWSEAQYIAPLTAGAVTIPCETLTSDLREGSLVGIWDSEKVSEIVEISLVSPGSVTLDVALSNSYIRPLLVPVRSATVEGNITRKTSGSSAELGVNFMVKDNITLTAETPQQYKNEDVYFTSFLLEGEYVQDSVISRDDVVDYNSGIRVKNTPWATAKQSRPFRIRAQTLAETWDVRRFLHRRAGKLKPFWVPSFEDNVTLDDTGLILSALKVRSELYTSMVGHRKDIAVLLSSGVWLLRGVVGAVDQPDGSVVFTLDSALNVQAATISKIMFLTLVRFDADRLELHWPGNAILDVTVPLLEII